MTAYLSSATNTITVSTTNLQSGNIQYALRAGSFEIKLNRIEYSIVGLSGDGNLSPDGIFTPQAFRYATGTISGGTAITPAPLRQGAPATTATSRLGQATSVSGTGTYLTNLLPANSGFIAAGGPSETYEFPFDLTVSAGGVFAMPMEWEVTGDSSMTLQITVYFEELRLSWHY